MTRTPRATPAIAPPACLQPAGTGCDLRVQVVPNASRTACAGLHDGALRLRLMAPPIDGRANAALLAWIAVELALPRRAVTLLSGDTQRRKRVHIDAPADRVAAWLTALLAAANGR